MLFSSKDNVTCKLINIDNVKFVKLDSNRATSDSLQCEGPLLGADDEGSD